MAFALPQLIFAIFLLFKVQCALITTGKEGGVQIEVDQSGEWTDPVEVPSANMALRWLDETCCWQSKLTVDIVHRSPPFLSVPVGQMPIGKELDLNVLWRKTIEDYRTKVAGNAKEIEYEVTSDATNSIAKRSAGVDQISVRLSANCGLRVEFLND